jgi:hypothetical protein
MSQDRAAFSTDASNMNAADDVTAQRPVLVLSCSRLGRVANPPSFSFADWFRSGRRGRAKPVSAA